MRLIVRPLAIMVLELIKRFFLCAITKGMPYHCRKNFNLLWTINLDIVERSFSAVGEIGNNCTFTGAYYQFLFEQFFNNFPKGRSQWNFKTRKSILSSKNFFFNILYFFGW